MLNGDDKVKIYPKHQAYLKILEVQLDNGVITEWSVIKLAYKKRALVVHPDKGGNEASFNELNTAFIELERLIVHQTTSWLHEAQALSSIIEILDELGLSVSGIRLDIKEIKTRISDLRLQSNFLENSISGLGVNTNKLKTKSSALSETFTRHQASMDELLANIRQIRAIVNQLTVRFDNNAPFYFGCCAAYLAIWIIFSKRSIFTFKSPSFKDCAIATGSYLIAISLFSQSKSRFEINHEVGELNLKPQLESPR